MPTRKYSQAQNRATQKYIRGNYDQIAVRLRKDTQPTRETLTKAAEAAGMSVNAYIMEAITDKMAHDGVTF